MRQNATPFYEGSQSRDCASQAKSAKLSGTKVPGNRINDNFPELLFLGRDFFMQQSSEKHRAIISGLIASAGMGIVQFIFILCAITFLYSIAIIFLPLSILLWVILFAFTGSSVRKRGGAGWQAGFWSGLSGGVFTSIGLGIGLSLMFQTANAFSIVMPYSFILTLIFTIVGTFFSALGGFIDQGAPQPHPSEQTSRRTIYHPTTGKPGREIYPRRVQTREVQGPESEDSNREA
jgi:hypothetical protein